ncbi:glycosyltransferase family 2 protein [Staphylococcus lugdunensis]|uniref:glycosyltransferase family 2 protein n=1 Tax=Staphylococcus lugdunensis TaxID=28035 RepID=UPI000A10A088|nr:glycosyltransferase family 2 protein [Staphylococcus lugdunensis]ARJ26459.1 glycosyl transferase family 2 [Staphylococcus lugdunensis]MCH8672579.1 glycosyltransferase family 2 protein [Staphylococcus lugdunensis]MCH8675897.1 glycosyltransferase family 2 protein [Staphylococcus lugdunensis]MCI2752791.1 glycosyltransferase family 2 protein [Staphylococcus lugdunensis]MCI2761529.1 glycosyltransferase family 2 protein [Staphylococcus lugdunensis]
MFSIIIPTYNSEKYIAHTLDKLLSCLYFEEDEIIVINDGSTDSTAQILKGYQNHAQIKIINQTNKGVSAARNLGMSLMSPETKLVTFIDDSDYVSTNFFKEASRFFLKHSYIKLASAPILIRKGHTLSAQNLNYRFQQRRHVVDITQQYQDIQYHIGGMVFRKSLFTHHKYTFDETIDFWEDAKFINTILLDVKSYGLIKHVNYFYNRDDYRSLSINSWKDQNRYAPHIVKNYLELIQRSTDLYGRVLPYIQYLVVLHYLNYILEHNQGYLNLKYIQDNTRFNIETKVLLQYISIEMIDALPIDNCYKHILYQHKGMVFPAEKDYKKINIIVHRYHWCSRELHFSLSQEAFDMSDSTQIYIDSHGKLKARAMLIHDKPLIILGVKVKNFSRKTFQIRLPRYRLLIGGYFRIIDNERGIKMSIYNPSLGIRMLKKLMYSIKYYSVSSRRNKEVS